MSKGLIVYLVAVFGIIAFVFGGIPYLQGISPANTKHQKSQVHIIEGVLGADIKSVKIGTYSPVELKSLNQDEQKFVKMMMGERGVFQKNDVVLLSLGMQSPRQKISFVRQEIRSNEVRIYVKVEDERLDGKQSEPSYLLGKITMPASMPISFHDEKTGRLLY